MTPWRKSTHSGGNGSNCVEVAVSAKAVLVRDTKHREGMALAFPLAAWRQFSMALKR